MTPHPYQSDYLTDIREGWKTFARQLVVSPTGSGKTCMFSWVAKEFAEKGARTLILVDQDELVWQTVDKLSKVAGLIGQPEKAEWRANKDAQVVVATVQSMARRLDQWPADGFGLVIADEADKSIAPQWQRVLTHFGSAKVCGFTATPHRTDKRNLGEFYENCIERENLISLITKGFLSPVSIKMLPIALDLSGRGSGKDFTDEEADEIIRPHLEEIARAVMEHGAFRRTLVFLPLIKTCETFNTIARDIGLSADYVFGQDPDRDAKLQRFRNWEFDVLANSMLLTRGVDIPAVDCIVPCRPTKSITLYFQMVGRGTRIAEGKTDCLLMDFLYQASKKLVCRPAHLVAKNDEEVEQITQLTQEPAAGLPNEVAAELDLLGLVQTATSQREEALRKKLEEHKNKQAQTISAEEFAMQHHSMDVAEFEPTMKWERDEITEKQLKWLGKAKIDPTTVRGKGHASKLLSLYFAHKPIQMATYAQRKKMAQMGHPSAWQATASEARQFFADLNRPKEQVLL